VVSNQSIGLLKILYIFERLNNSMWGVTESRGFRLVKQVKNRIAVLPFMDFS
jgi:hypothetical protein